MQFAKLEMWLVLATLLRNFFWEIDPSYKLVTKVDTNLTPEGGIPMKFIYRQD